MIVDITTGEPALVYFTDLGRGRGVRLSTKKKADDDRPRWIDYRRFEHGFLAFLDELDWHSVLGEAESEELPQAEEQAASATLAVEQDERQVERITDLLIDTPSAAPKTRLLKAETELEAHRADKVAAEQRLEELEARHRALLDTSVAFTKLAESNDTATRSRLREEIRRKVAKIELECRHVFDVLTLHRMNHRSLRGSRSLTALNVRCCSIAIALSRYGSIPKRITCRVRPTHGANSVAHSIYEKYYKFASLGRV
jgi:hypothetical protein